MRRANAIATVVLLLGCGGAGQDESADAPTQRQRDSAIAASNLPGAQGVGGALDAADSAAARRARLDSLGQD